MRVLVRAAVGFAAGVALQALAGGRVVLWAAAALAFAALTVARRWGAWTALAALALGGLLASVRGQARAPDPPDGELLFAGTVERPEEKTLYGRQVLVTLDAGASAIVYEREAGARPPLLPGDHVRFRGSARRPRGYLVDGAFDREELFRARGIDRQIAAAAPGIIADDATPSWWSAWRIAAALRERAGAGLEAASDGDGGALLDALVLGRRGRITPAVDDAFRRAGVAHVLSVSGLHLAAAAALFFAAARQIWLRLPGLAARIPADRAAAVCALPAAAGYTLLTGAEVATVRSLVCAAIVLGARALGRSADGLTALAAAAVVLLAASPLVLFDASFQLSFAAAAALTAIAPRLRGPRVVKLVLASAAATLATAPLTALHFGVVQPAGVLTNLVVVPLAELAILPLGLLGAGLAVISPTVAAPVVCVAGWGAGALAWLVGLMARAAPSIEVPPPTRLELFVLGVTVALLLAGPWRRGLIAAAVAVAFVAGWEIHAGVIAPARRADATITFLDVGQGSSAVIEAPAGETWLVDSGGRLFGDDGGTDPGEQSVLRFLRAHRARHLDLVVITHPHPDHYGGLAAVAARISVGELWISGDDPGDRRWRELLASLEAAGTRIVRVAAGASRTSGGARLTILGGGADPGRSVNDNSLVAAVEMAGRRVLLPGDIEAEGEAALLAGGASVASDVVAVPHHGSRTSSTPSFVAAVHPRLAVVSCGEHNHFGFPAARVVNAWQAAGAEVLRTDRDGAITITLSPDGHFAWNGHLRTRYSLPHGGPT